MLPIINALVTSPNERLTRPTVRSRAIQPVTPSTTIAHYARPHARQLRGPARLTLGHNNKLSQSSSSQKATGLDAVRAYRRMSTDSDPYGEKINFIA